MTLSKNFELSEFACHDGTPVPDKYLHNAIELAANLQVLRDYFGEPIYISSGYRSDTWNDRIGGKGGSKHKYAQAADITMKNHSPVAVQNAIEYLIGKGLMKNGGVGKYNGFTHYDVRDIPARW